MKISNYSETQLKITYPQKYASMAPTLLDTRTSFRLHGVNNAIAASIIRTACGEMPVNYLRCEYDNFITDDPYIIPELVISRLLMIPINQAIPKGTKYELEFKNNSPILETVKTSLLVSSKPNNADFNKNITICKIPRGKSLKITAFVMSAPSYIPGFGGLSLAYDGVALPVDHDGSGKEEQSNEAFKQYAKTGIKTSVSRPTMYDISFKQHIGGSGRALLKQVCANIITRIKRVSEFISTKNIEYNTHTYRILDESETIGNLFEKHIVENYPTIGSVIHKSDLDVRIVSVVINNKSDPDDIMRESIAALVSTFEKIEKLF